MRKRILAILMTAIMCCLQLAGFVPAEKVEAAYSVTEEDIYYKCPEYLDNKAYDNYMVRCEERIEKGMATISDAEGLGASILYSLQNGAGIIISELASLAKIGQSTKDKLNKEVVYQLIQAYLSSDTSATDTASQIGNAYSTISDAYNVANATDLYNYKESLKSSSLNLSGNQVDKLVDMYTEADTFSKILGYAGDAQKAVKIITAYIEMQDMDLAVLNKLDDAFSSMDSEFASAIQSIMSDRNSDFLTFAKKNYLQDEVIKKMVSVVAKYGSSPVLFVKNVCASILGKIYKSFCPTADQIIQAGMCQAYTYLARNKVNQLRKEFKNGKASQDKIEQYKLVYGFYITTMKTTMDKVAGCVNGSDKSVKQALKSWAGSLSGFTYATYMERCRSEASADVSAGRLKISGNTVTRKTSDGTTIDENYDSTESIKARLAAIKQKYPPNQGVTWKGKWGGATQCFGFARMVFFLLYGKEMPANYYPNACYQYQQNSGVNKVGQLTGNFTAAQVQQLFAQAKIGDVIQASITASSGQHTMIFTGLTSKGITVYDCNAAVNGCAPGGCGINEWERSYSELAKGTYGYGSSNGGITIYRADNYASIYGNGDDVFYDDSANFIIEDGVLVKYTGWQPFVEIPDTVTAIGKQAFLNNKTMMYVLIPDSVKSIGESAFKGCTSLLSVSIPDSVETIGNSAFEGCTSLGYAYLPNNAKYTVIESRVFGKCSTLKEIELPDNITQIGALAFNECHLLEQVSFNEQITLIDDGAFRDCESITDLVLPQYVAELGWESFAGCDGITELEIPKSLKKASAFGYSGTARFGPFSECDNLSTITFQKGTKEIAEGLFGNCTGLKEIVIPNSIKKIGRAAFTWCSNLETVEFSANLVDIDEVAFYHCDKLVISNFPDAVTRIGARAFEECNSLKEVILPSNLTELEWQAFASCSQIRKIEIPKFLKKAETWGDGWYPKSGPFSDCNNLKEVVFQEGITKVADGLFGNCTGLEEIIIPDTVKEIGEGAFTYCSNLKKVKLPDGIEKIAYVAFRKCTILENVEIPEGLKSIGAGAFVDCQSITEITLPDSISEMGDSVFQGCGKLEKVKLPLQLRKIEDYMFADCISLKEISFPQKLELIGIKAFCNCIMLDDLVLSQSISEINKSAFDGCEGLNKINLPKDVLYIREAAFRNCSTLTQVKMSNLVNYMGENVFENCNLLTDVILSAKLKVIPSQTFQGCSSLESIILPYQVETIGDDAFKNCTKLRKITIPKATTSISDSAFSYPDKITIYGVAGSYAEQYATENDIAFVAQEIATEEVTLTETELTLGRNTEYQLTAGLSPMDSTDEVTWSSSDENVAKVDQTGKIQAIAVGEAVITAKAGEKTATCKVTVNVPMTSIRLNKTSIELNSIGDSYQLQANYSPSDAEGTIIWKSDDEGIASVDQTGKVTAVGKGTTTITASCGNLADTCTVVSKGESSGTEILPSPSPTPQPNNTPAPTQTPKPSNPPVPTQIPKPSDSPAPTQIPRPSDLPTPPQTAAPSVSPTPSGRPLPSSKPTSVPSQTTEPLNGDETPKPTKAPLNTIENKNSVNKVEEKNSSGTNEVKKSNTVVVGKVKLIFAKNIKKGKIKATWKKLTNVSGYQIQYAPNKKFKKAKRKTVKSTSVTIKKLKKKKTYFVRVRAYKLADGKKVYGKWSSVKKVKVKK